MTNEAKINNSKVKEKTSAKGIVCVALVVLFAFVLGCAEFVVIGIEPELSRDYNVTLAQVGQLMSFFAVAYAICTPVLALSTGRFKRFTLLVAYSIVFCAANLAAVLAQGLTTLLLTRVFLGIVSGAMLGLGITYIPEFVSAKRTPMCISLVYAAFSVAMVAATSLGKIVAQTLHWHYAFVGVFVLSIVVCALLLLMLPKTGETDEPATVHEQLPLLRDSRTLGGIAIFLFGVGSVYVFYAYITPYFEDILGLSVFATSTALMAYGCVCFISNLLSGWCASRFGLPALVVGFSVQATLLFTLFMLAGAMPISLVVVMFMALSMYILSVPCVTMFMEVARTEYPKATTLAASLEPMAFNIGIAFGTCVGGAVVTGPGMVYLGLVGAIFSLVALALTFTTMHLVKRHRLVRRQQNMSGNATKSAAYNMAGSGAESTAENKAESVAKSTAKNIAGSMAKDKARSVVSK